jgi:hypothetical protein
LPHLVDEPDVSASHFVEVARRRRIDSAIDSATWLGFDHDLQWRVECVEQPPEAAEPPGSICFWRAIEAEWTRCHLHDV